MLPISQNGYSANKVSLTAVYTIPGTHTKVRLRRGDTATVLLYVAKRFNAEVESIDQGADDWGYAPRFIRGSSRSLSNHASGTAIDLNATQHPLGTDPRHNFTAHQIECIHAILKSAGGVVRWGGDYLGRKDGMHLEVIGTPDEVAAVARKIKAGFRKPIARVLRIGSEGKDVKAVQARLITLGLLPKGSDDGVYGRKTAAAIKALKVKRKWLGVLHNNECGKGTVHLLGGNLVWTGR